MSKQARNYTSNILDELLSEITSEEQRKTDKRMLLALKIEKAMKAKNWKKGDLAIEMNKKPSVITKWLSGTHNFESNTLFDLEEKLGITLVSIEDRKQIQPVIYHVTVQSTVMSDPFNDGRYNIPSQCVFVSNFDTNKLS
jgi:ribosome-binding protein aMBF1 (putative translation factor)